MNNLIATVAVEKTFFSADSDFDYIIPVSLINNVKIGCMVKVPFGNGNKLRCAIVVNIYSAINSALKEIDSIIGDKPIVSEEFVALSLWLKERCFCTTYECLRLMLPRGFGKVGDASAKTVTLLIENENDLPKLTPKQRSVVDLLFDVNTASVSEICELCSVGTSVLKNLEKYGVISIFDKEIYRNPYKNIKVKEQKKIELTFEQSKAYDTYSNMLLNTGGSGLLYGVTGSGKTEVYLNLTAKALAEGRQVLVLVPEIALTAQIVKRFQSWFKGCIAVVHSKLSASERADVFYKIRNNEAQILIGVRSAVFAPFTNLGLVIIDEEHDQSYKQEERPCYHAREVALHRAEYFNIPVVLGSATPSIESYYDAIMKQFKHLRLTGRPNGQPLPKVQIVDMRKELQERNFSVLSRTLQQELVRTAAAGEQAIVLLNRRGYSTFVMCRDCGETIMCPHCAVALVYHEEGKAMRCHYCGNTMPVPEECPKCHSRRIKFFGTGTQKAEAQIAALPEVKVLRMDQDSTLRKFAHEEILNAFSSGRYNVLIGTQMVAKGHDIPNVTLVGVLSADSMLNMPDFRAYERAFSLLTQAAGRAGRGDKPGHVILQVYDADNRTVHLAAAQDYDTFAKEELLRRKELNYPPYAAFLKITVWDKNEERANGTAKEIADFLEQQAKNTDAEVFGPFAGIIGKVRDLYRVNVLVKSTQINIFKTALWQSPYRDMKNVYFDVDPFNVL